MVEVRPVSKPKVAASKSFFRENPRGDSQKKDSQAMLEHAMACSFPSFFRPHRSETPSFRMATISWPHKRGITKASADGGIVLLTATKMISFGLLDRPVTPFDDAKVIHL